MKKVKNDKDTRELLHDFLLWCWINGRKLKNKDTMYIIDKYIKSCNSKE